MLVILMVFDDVTMIFCNFFCSNYTEKSNVILHSQIKNTIILDDIVLYRKCMDKIRSEYSTIIDFVNEFNDI